MNALERSRMLTEACEHLDAAVILLAKAGYGDLWCELLNLQCKEVRDEAAQAQKEHEDGAEGK